MPYKSRAAYISGTAYIEKLKRLHPNFEKRKLQVERQKAYGKSLTIKNALRRAIKANERLRIDKIRKEQESEAKRRLG